jgi:predicted O-linked N-acetylglucosamine transferase (SPINDLY family)
VKVARREPIAARLERALTLHRGGEVEPAAAIYREVLARKPDHVDALHLLGLAERELGHLAEAIALLRRTTALRPAFAEAHCNLGMALHEHGTTEEAIACYRRALSLNQGLPEPWFNLGNALAELGERKEAAQCYARAAALRPFAEAHHRLADLLLARGEISEAIAQYQRAVALRPDLADACASLASALQQCGRIEEAVRCYCQAILARPDDAPAHNNLGNALRDLGRNDEAILCYQRALALRADLVEAWSNLGNALRQLGRLDEAERLLRRAIALKPDFAEAHLNLGNVLQLRDRFEEAIDCFHLALAHRGDFAQAHNNLGVAYTDSGRHDEAIDALCRAIELNPEFAEAHNNLGTVYKHQGRLHDAVACFRRAVELKPDYVAAHSNLLFTLNYMEDVPPQQILEEHCAFARQHAAQCNVVCPHGNEPDRGRRLRVGYVSPDLRNHSCALFLEPLLAQHDRAAFEVFAYAEVANPDAVTARLRALVDHWRSTVGMSDEALAARIREDRIDIIVDLAGHTANHRLLALARKPAPIQLTWLGYPATTGLPAMTHRLTDARTDPPGMTERHYTEELVRLPQSLWCYRPPAAMPEVGELPALRNGYLTFGSFNNFAKVGPSVVRLWARLLCALPDARLILLTVPPGAAQQRVAAAFAAQGVDTTRLELLHKLPRVEYLAVHHRVDLALDPFPCNGGTTTCEALWMGVPVITLIGNTFVSRAGFSLLSVAGLPEFGAATEEDYIDIADRCANDVRALAATRARLRERLRASPLMDEAQFTRDVEAAYRDLWQRWCTQVRTRGA